MNIEKADYATIIRFGTIHDLNMKLQMEGKNLIEVSNIIDKDGISLLEKSLIARKFDIAKELLANNAKVNKMGCSIRMLINERGTDKLKKIMECTE